MTIQERRDFCKKLLAKVDDRLKVLSNLPKKQEYANEIERLKKIQTRLEKSFFYWFNKRTIGEQVRLLTGFECIKKSDFLSPETIKVSCMEVGLSDEELDDGPANRLKSKLTAAIFALMHERDYSYNVICSTNSDYPSRAQVERRIEELKIKLLL